MSKRVALGPAIKAIRTAKGIAGGKFATDCLMSHAHLCNIEADRREPTPEALARIAQALDVSLDAISLDISDYIRSAA
jgi:transcriptional regulator with XRE-family HTH domain